MSKVLEQFIKETYTSRQVPDFRVGDIVKVYQIVPDIKVQKKLSKTAKAIKKTQDKDKVAGKRIQIFEGVVIAKKHGREPGASFTVRKIASHNIGVEKIFPLYSPLVKKIEVVSRPGRVRRAKLYFLRDRVGKKARRLGVGTAVEQKRTTVGASDLERAELAAKEAEAPDKSSNDDHGASKAEEKAEASASAEAADGQGNKKE